MSMTSVVGAQYKAYTEQYNRLMAEDALGALKHGETAAKKGVELAVLQTAFGIGAK